MKSPMKKTAQLVILLLITFITSSAFAQQGEKRGNRPEGPPPIPNKEQVIKMVTDLANEINLSESQNEKILALFNAHFKEVKEKIDENERKQKEMETLKESFENDVKSILTENQQKAYDDFLRKQHPPKRRKK